MSSEPRRVLVHPSFAIEWRDFDDFRGEFGPYNGRYVPRYPTGWVGECLRHLQDLDLPPLQRARVLERASKELRHCTIPTNQSWASDLSWEENAAGLTKSDPDALIVGNGLDPKPFAGWAQCVSEIRESRERSWAYKGTIREYLNFCTPLLLNAPAAYLIDPYLDPLDLAVQDLLNSIFERIKGSKCYQVHIITRQQTCGGRKDEQNRSDWMTTEQIEASLRESYANRIGKLRSLHVHLVQRTMGYASGALRLHDRFFLTNFGAIAFGRGFVLEHQELSQETANVVDRKLHETLKAIWVDGVARHQEALRLPVDVPKPYKVISAVVMGT